MTLKRGARRVEPTPETGRSGAHPAGRPTSPAHPPASEPVCRTPVLPNPATSEDEDDRISEARLVEEVRKGRQESFGVLVRRYEHRLLRVIRRFIRDPDIAEDLAQETFLRAYERMDQFDPSRRFGPWLFRIGVNLTLDHHRRKKRRLFAFLFSDRATEDWPDPPTADPRAQVDLHQEVRHVVDKLPEEFRTVLILRDLENFSTSEIAAILDRKEATIRWRLAEARNRFQVLWEKRRA